jgi:ATP-binding cassette subfamily B protein
VAADTPAGGPYRIVISLQEYSHPAIEPSRWPASRLGEALLALARLSALPVSSDQAPNPPTSIPLDDPGETGHWIEATGALLNLDIEPRVLTYSGAEQALPTLGPAILRLSDGSFVALAPDRRLLGPDRALRKVSASSIRSALFRYAEQQQSEKVDSILAGARMSGFRLKRARAALLRDLLAQAYAENCWLIRLPSGAGFWLQLRRAGIPARLAALAGVHLFQYALWLLSWFMIGQGALTGRLDRGWLLGWALILISLVPLRVLTTWLRGGIAITTGGLLKERLLAGALRLHPDEIRHQGVGRFLSRVIESDALESLALSGGFLALVSIIELVLSAFVLGAGAGGALHAFLLAVWTLFLAALGWRYFKRQRKWSDARLGLTDDLVERMVGHRTRLAQESPENWHAGEDQSLESYLRISRSVDSIKVMLTALAPRGWLVLALATLAPAFLSAQVSVAALAVSIGGILLAFRALRRLAAGFASLGDAAIAWRQMAPLFHAASRPDLHGSPAFALAARPQSGPVVEAHDLVFTHSGRNEPVLRGCTLSILHGDRIVLEGPSGGGKSTLASLITGIRSPQSGLLLAAGLDRHTLGNWGWRRRVAAAPQFHENHVLTGPFVFNLLMGRQRLIGPKDFDEAETVCRELGLGPLLERMPAGLLQLVGETGWQLSHGERSRLFIARALLQGAELVVLDESFAALDPENLRLAIDCVNRRAPAVLAIAHQ